jgi:hypothetical protein
MIWFFAGVIGYICGHVPIHFVITHFTKKTCPPTVMANVQLREYGYAFAIFSWFFIMPFLLWYIFYYLSLNPFVAHTSVAFFTLGNGLPLANNWLKYKQIIQIYPFFSLLFILSIKIAFVAVLLSGIVFFISKKPLKTRAFFVFIGLMGLMLFPQKSADIFYILPIGILLLMHDYVTFSPTYREKRFIW